MQQPNRHARIDAGLELQKQKQKHTLAQPLPSHLDRPDHVIDLFFKQRRNVMPAVVGQDRKVHHRRHLGRREAFDELLDKLGMAEEFFVIEISGVSSHQFCAMSRKNHTQLHGNKNKKTLLLQECHQKNETLNCNQSFLFRLQIELRSQKSN
ncbi:hypothetical protein Thiofri_03946 [Thiorhodovibrio frisius]|nr:hypothetical protein Thiofri_03946 [Thiorhodovibrio frisius]